MTPMSARSPIDWLASRITPMALGVDIVISMATMPPAMRASESAGTCSGFWARTTAMTPGLVRSEMISDLVRIVASTFRGSGGGFSTQFVSAIRFGTDGFSDAAAGKSISARPGAARPCCQRWWHCRIALTIALGAGRHRHRLCVRWHGRIIRERNARH